jgi:hypothetical protein
MFYYGQSCRNLVSTQLLSNPDIIKSKANFYKKLNDYNPATNQYTGSEQILNHSRELIENVTHPAIETVAENNKEFIRQNENEINSMTSLLQLISLKYLGNVKAIIQYATDIPATVQSQLQNIPGDIDNLKIIVKKALIDPAYMKYSEPLRKLYQSLSDIPDN